MHSFLQQGSMKASSKGGRLFGPAVMTARVQSQRPESGRRGRLHPTTFLGARPEPGASPAIAPHSAGGRVPGTAVQMRRDQRWGSPPAGVAHPSSQAGHRPVAGAHRRPGCSCPTAAWTGRAWTPRSGSKTWEGETGTMQGGRAAPAASPGSPGVSRPGPAHPRPARPPQRLTKGSGPPPPRSLGRRRPPPRARWGPAAASSPPPPAPSCQLQPQRGPGLPRGPARTREDPGGAARRAPAAASRRASRCKPRRVRATASPRRAALPLLFVGSTPSSSGHGREAGSGSSQAAARAAWRQEAAAAAAVGAVGSEGRSRASPAGRTAQWQRQ